MGIYLFKATNRNFRTRCEICSKLTKTSKWPHWHENIMKHWWCSDVFIVNFEQISHLFLVFHCWIWESVDGWVYRPSSKSRDVKIMTHARAGTKLCNINQRSQTTTWKETCIELKKYAECKLWSNIYKMYWDFHFLTLYGPHLPCGNLEIIGL